MHNTTRGIAHVVDEYSLVRNEFIFMHVLRNTWGSTYLFICKPKLNKTLVPYKVDCKVKVGSKTANLKEYLVFVSSNTYLLVPTLICHFQ